MTRVSCPTDRPANLASDILIGRKESIPNGKIPRRDRTSDEIRARARPLRSDYLKHASTSRPDSISHFVARSRVDKIANMAHFGSGCTYRSAPYRRSPRFPCELNEFDRIPVRGLSRMHAVPRRECPVEREEAKRCQPLPQIVVFAKSVRRVIAANLLETRSRDHRGRLSYRISTDQVVACIPRNVPFAFVYQLTIQYAKHLRLARCEAHARIRK